MVDAPPTKGAPKYREERTMRNHRTRGLPNRIAPAALGLAVLLADFAGAQVVDQSQLNGADQNQAFHSTRSVGQTFTVGLTGQLTGIEMSIFPSGSPAGTGDLIVEVLDMSGGVIGTAPVLGSVSLSETDLGASPSVLSAGSVTATLIDLTGLGLAVQAGDALAVQLKSARALPDLYVVRIALTDSYPGGEYFVSGVALPTADAAFKTFVAVGGLIGSPGQISLSAGGTQTLSLNLTAAQAGKSYLVLGSASGTAPGLVYAGTTVPLNLDGYLLFTLLNPNSPPLGNSGGLLDASGDATATFTLPPSTDPSLAGLTVHHAGFALDLVGGAFVLPEVTNAVPVTLVP
jgi:hypothetical protein